MWAAKQRRVVETRGAWYGRMIVAAFAALAASAAFAADPTRLAFKPADQGYFEFDTGMFRGRVKLDGKSQGVGSMVHVPSGREITRKPGLFSYYRVFSTDTRYGHTVRDWPTVPRVLADGALEVVWPSAEEHPLEITAVHRWSAPDTLDVETIVRPKRDMPRMEVFVSFYFTKDFQALIYVKPNLFEQSAPRLISADVNPLVNGTYLIFPRDREVVPMIFDRRWEFPPNPMQWSVTRLLAGPLAVRRSHDSGLTAVLMAQPDDCFAVSTPYNKTPPDVVSAHASLYMSLFGRDVAAGATACARSRLVLGHNLTNQQAIDLYQRYVGK